MGKKEIFLIIGLIVLSLGVGVFLGKMRNTSGKEDISTQSTASEGRGGEAAPYNTVNQPMMPQYDYTAQIQKVLRERPNDAKALAEVADLYFDQHKFPDAIEYYKKAIALDPQDIDSYNDLGLSYHYIGKPEEGLKYVDEALRRNPVYQRVWLTKGFILATTGRIPEARTAWEKAYSIDPNSDVGRSAASFLAQHQGIGK